MTFYDRIFGQSFLFGRFFIFLFYFLPIPEEVLLLGIGYLVDIGDLNVYLAVAVSIAGIIATDNMWYWLGRSNSRLLAKLKNKIGKEKLENYEKFLKKHPGKYVFLSRFIPVLGIIGPGRCGVRKI